PHPPRDAPAPTPPPPRSGCASPATTAHHLIAVADRGSSSAAHRVTIVGTHEAVGRADDPFYPARAISPRHRSGIYHCSFIPLSAEDQVIAVIDERDHSIAAD